MPEIQRGPDLNTWFDNRGVRRRETSELLSKLRDAQAKVSKAAGAVTPLGHEPVPGESPDDLLKNANASLSELDLIAGEIDERERLIPSEEMAFNNEKARIDNASMARARQQAELAKQQAKEARWAKERRKQKLLKFAKPALVVLVLILFMIRC